MKAAIINTVIGTGSVGRVALGTADEIISNGGEALLCRGRGEAVKGYDNYRIGSDPDMFWHGIMTRITDRHGLYSRGATQRLIKRLTEYDPDVIQLHNVHGYYVNYPMFFDWLKTCNKPIVWTLHDCWSFTGHCAHYEYCGCDRWESEEGCALCPQKSEYPASFIKDASRHNYLVKKDSFTGVPNLHIVTPSNWLKNTLSRSFLKDYPVSVINTGIDMELFNPEHAKSSKLREKHEIKDETVILGIANPWRETKGLYDFRELYEKLEEKAPGRYRIVMIGLKPSQAEEMPEGIIRLGHTESVRELAEWYGLSDIYVNLTYGDTFPTTNIEALACGTPVITYNAGGSGEALDDKCGRVVERGDLDAVVSAIEELEDLAKSGEDMTSVCADKAQNYRKQDRYRDYYELYQKI
ncbi:MAG: glycosyltransferase [Lachnospiraceae bacterium]|nr:glycosyltransferase [Lachnospiraceae bacterium]